MRGQELRYQDVSAAADMLWKLWKQLKISRGIKLALLAGMVEGGHEQLEKLGISLIFSEGGVTWDDVPKTNGPQITDTPNVADSGTLEPQSTMQSPA